MADKDELAGIHAITGIIPAKQASYGSQVASRRPALKGVNRKPQGDVVTISVQGRQAEEKEEQEEAQAGKK